MAADKRDAVLLIVDILPSPIALFINYAEDKKNLENKK